MLYILKKRKRFSKDVKNVFELITFNMRNTDIMGSAGLSSQKYFSDYDLFEVVFRDYNDFESVYKDFLKMIDDIEKSGFVYFQDFKLGVDNNNNSLHWSLEEIKHSFKDIKYKNTVQRKYFINALKDKSLIKLDVSAFINNVFVEFSNIYDIHYDKKTFLPNIKDIIISLKIDMIDLLQQGQYMKYLKRLFTVSKLERNYDILKPLTNLFNSKYGKMYKLASQIKTILTMKQVGYDLEDRYKKAVETINTELEPKYQIADIKDLSRSYFDIMEVVNNKAKNYIDI
jgi:hypothetical protein